MYLLLLVGFIVLGVAEDTCTTGGCDIVEDDIEMEYRYLGRSGLSVSALGYGNMNTFEQVGVEASLEIVKYLVDKGVNFFDTSEAYGDGVAETVLGEVIAIGIERKYWKRSDLVISTKVYFGFSNLLFPNVIGLSRKHIIEGVTDSLDRLKLTYVDVVFCHRSDLHTPIEETVRAMNWLIDQGKVFYWGTSEWSLEEILEARHVADRLGLIGPIVEQPEYSVLNRYRFEREYSILYDTTGLGTTVWGALAGGVLSGKYNDGIPEDSRMKLYPFFKVMLDDKNFPSYKGGFDYMVETTRALGKLADDLGCTTSQLAYAWVLKNPRTSTLLMGGKLKYLKENIGALKVVEKLTPDVLEKIDSIVGNVPVPRIDIRGWTTTMKSSSKNLFKTDQDEGHK